MQVGQHPSQRMPGLSCAALGLPKGTGCIPAKGKTQPFVRCALTKAEIRGPAAWSVGRVPGIKGQYMLVGAVSRVIWLILISVYHDDYRPWRGGGPM